MRAVNWDNRHFVARRRVSIGVNSLEFGLPFIHAVDLSISWNLPWAYTAAVTKLRTSRLNSGETLGRITIKSRLIDHKQQPSK